MGRPPMERSWALRATNTSTFCWILAKGRRSAAVYLSQHYPYSQGISDPDVHRHQSVRTFIKHRDLIASIARQKLFLSREPPTWISVAAQDLHLTP
jgi:hypothetical protein